MPRWAFGKTPYGNLLYLVPLIVLSLVFGGFVLRSRHRIQRVDLNSPNIRYPPLYKDITEAELYLPQHDKNLPSPEGRDGRFVRFENQMWGVGLNNQLFEAMLNSEIARRAGRGYVFAPIIWDAWTWDPYVKAEGSHLANADSGEHSLRPAKVPLRAFIESPTSGAPWPSSNGDSAQTPPRSISLQWYDKICPSERRIRLEPRKVNRKIGVNLKTDEGIDIVTKWADYLLGLDASCVDIVGEDRLIDFEFFESNRVISIWETFSKSPVLTAFRWSSIVDTAVRRNIRHFSLLPSRSRVYAGSSSSDWADAGEETSYIPGLVTLHVRRRDYYGHCIWASGWAQFEGWNLLPFLPDRFDPPGPPSATRSNPHVDLSTDARAQYALSRCWIEIEAIVKRLAELRQSSKTSNLRKVYVSTNGEKEWVDRLKQALKDDGWEDVYTTVDLDMGWYESGVDSAIDMEMSSRGEVFVGNGFSTFTSTIVALRLTRDIKPQGSRFW